MSKSTERLVPQDLEAERSLIGAILMDTDVLGDVADKITAIEFYEPAHQKIFSAILRLYENDKPIDLLTLSRELKSKNELDEIGGREYLVDVAGSVPTAANATAYAELVRDAATRRNYIHAAAEITDFAFSDEFSGKDLNDKIEGLIYNASKDYSSDDLVPFEQLAGEAFNRIEDMANNPDKLRGLKTGFPDLDRVIMGLNKSELLILAARPAMGKSTLAQNIMTNVAMKEKKPVVYFSLEMGSDQLTDRILAAQSGIDSQRIRSGRLKGDDFTKITEAISELSDAPILIDQSAGLSILEIRTKARRMRNRQELGLIVVDYLQLMQASRASRDPNRVQEVSEISRGLKLLARELDVPVLALSQLSRAVESRTDKRPMLSDLRESGSIEQDADVVMFMYRDGYYDKDGAEDQDMTELIVAKNRSGPSGETIYMKFFPDNLKFVSYSRKTP